MTIHIRPNFYNKALRIVHSNVQYTERPSGGETIAWDNDENVIELDETKIQAEIDKFEAEFDAQGYARNRASEYPSNGDQWDMMYKDNLNSTTTHKDAVEVVKTKWPKDNSGPV